MSAIGPIEIVGGGLAGLSLGLGLREAGVPTVVYEAGQFPRHRVCGEFIAGLDGDTIARLGLGRFLGDAHRHHEVGWHTAGRAIQRQRLPEAALGISRYALDARLADAFVGAGGDLRTGTRCTDLTPRPGRVVATGRVRGKSDWLGLKLHVRGLALGSDLEVHLGREAYVGLSPVEGGDVNVCGLFRRRPGRGGPSDVAGTAAGRAPRIPPAADDPAGVMIDWLRRCGLGSLAARVATAEADERSFGSIAGLQFGRPRAAPGELRVGDAFAMIPPFTGNGMAMAFQSAAIALDPLTRYARGEIAWAEACRVTQGSLRGRFGLRLASADVLHPFLTRPRRQQWLAALGRVRLVPFRPLYAALH